MTAFAVLAVFGLQLCQSGTGGSPYYTADSIANSAAGVAGLYAPNTFISIYGQNLAYVTRALQPSDISSGILPTVLPGTGLRVTISSILADIYYVSPTQVNILVPTSMTAGTVTLQLEVDGIAGPAINITLATAAPSLFQSDATTVLATHLDGSVITAASPALPGEVVVLWASGAGPTSPEALPNEVARSAASITPISSFTLLMNGTAVDPSTILYAGVAPGFAGLYQINWRVPANAPANPEIRIGYAGALSPPGRFLPIQ